MESQPKKSKKMFSFVTFAIFIELIQTFSLPAPLVCRFSYPKGIGRMILKEEMRARSGCHDNGQWGSGRSSRCGSKEALNHHGCESEFESVAGRSAVVIGRSEVWSGNQELPETVERGVLPFLIKFEECREGQRSGGERTQGSRVSQILGCSWESLPAFDSLLIDLLPH